MANFCATCGAEINEGSKFCKGCGAAVEAEAQPAYQPPSPQPGGYAPPPQQAPQYDGQPPQQAQPYAGPPQQPPQYDGPPPQQAPVGDAALGVPPTVAQPAYQPPPQQAPQGYVPPQQTPQGYAPPQPPKKKLPTWLLIVIIAVAAIVFFGIIGVLSQDSDSDSDASDSEVVEIDVDDDSDADDVGDSGDAGDADDDGDADDADDAGSMQITQFTDDPIVVGEGTDFPLQGMLSIPDVEGKVPAVVLVHGDGFFDMDEETDGNKPFRDIAEYLASHGIAAIRYDKRSFKYYWQMKEKYGGGVTAVESQIEDAVLAAELVKSDPRIDENKVFILGHSKGAALAPRIHTEGGGFAGIIAMSGTPRSIFDFSFNEYLEYAATMPEGKEKDEYLAEIEERVEEYRDRIMSMPEDEAKETDLGEFTYYYVQEYENHLPTEYIKDISIPFLILQGSEDFAVSAIVDLPAWQDALAGRSNATFNLYEGLNHFLFPSAGYGKDEWEKEYSAPGHTDGQVLEDIADWILSN
ncbi:MAG: alpha/beta hydrolase [Clostridiales bacterium]|nr:alpha/beta hydrolase [Clostridiales bacterium]